MTLPDGAGQVYAVATRLSVLDVNGFPAAGSNTFTTTTVMKVTATPVFETGDDLVSKNAAGDIAVMYKHGDMPKYYTAAIELAVPDNFLEQCLCGGNLLTDISAALGVVTGAAAVAGSVGAGTLPIGTYGYRVTQANQYGETIPGAETLVTTAGIGSVVIAGMVVAAGAVQLRLYGRTPGQEQLLQSLPVVSPPTTTTASGTGAGPFNLAVAFPGIPASMPAGYTFEITGDPNAVKIVFTTTQEVSKGAQIIPVTASIPITTTIPPGLVIPVFVDTGAAIPSGAQPAADGTAGPGQTGYQAPALGIVGNPNGVALEMWTKAILTGRNAPQYPYNRWLLPQVANVHQEARNFTNAILENAFTGDSFQNPNFGAGPFGDWDYDSTRVFQRARRGATDLPTPGLNPVLATA